jgi:predicted nucleic acid-binding protein
MVLVDTSVWIRALANREPYRTELAELLASSEVAGHELVCGELLIGDPGGRKKVLASYALIPWAAYVPHHNVAALVNTRRFHGRGASWIDIHLVAAALVAGLELWTSDACLSEIAEELGVAYRPRMNGARGSRNQ